MDYEQDKEDYEQEKRIKEWLESQQREPGQIEYQYINSKGNVRSSNFQGARLDQIVGEDSTTTLLDFVAGCDGRDLEYRCDVNLYNEIDKYLVCLGFDEEMSEWIIRKMLRSLETINKLLSEKSQTDSEW